MKFDSTNWRREKIISLEAATALARSLRAEGKRLVTVNGSFDILHAGHLDQLEEARKQGDVLFLGINSDASITAEKGPNRPLLPEQARAALLAALVCVDYVIIIDAAYSEVPHVLLNTVQPAIHVNGPDYGMAETWIEWPTMQKYATVGYSVQRRNRLSTSAIVQKIRDTK